MKNNPLRVLYVHGGVLERGGTEAFIMNYYRNIDRTKVQFDFVVHGFAKGVYHDEVESLGGKIYHVPIKSKDYLGNIKALKKIFNTNEYKIVHSHMDAMGMVVLKTAKKCGIPIRIAHSHSTNHQTNNKIKYTLNEYARMNIKKYATHLFACSEKAGHWLFGDKAFGNNEVKLVNNAIEFNRFCFDEDKRSKIRKQLFIQDDFVIGHIGRLSIEKNHIFLLDIFKEVLKLMPNAKLLLAGSGELKNQIEEKIKHLDISNNVLLLGIRSDISDLINAFDVFLFPSLFEGLGFVLIEAQANGLQCFASDVVPKEVNILNKITYIPLTDPAAVWADKIFKNYNNQIEREVSKGTFAATGYDIKDCALKLQNMYLEFAYKV